MNNKISCCTGEDKHCAVVNCSPVMWFVGIMLRVDILKSVLYAIAEFSAEAFHEILVALGVGNLLFVHKECCITTEFPEVRSEVCAGVNSGEVPIVDDLL